MSTFGQDHFLLHIHLRVLAALLDLMPPHRDHLSACNVLLECSPLLFQPLVRSVHPALHHQLVLQLADRADLVPLVPSVQVCVRGAHQELSKTSLVVPHATCARLVFSLLLALSIARHAQRELFVIRLRVAQFANRVAQILFQPLRLHSVHRAHMAWSQALAPVHVPNAHQDSFWMTPTLALHVQPESLLILMEQCALLASQAHFLHPDPLRVLIVPREVIAHSVLHLALVARKGHGHPYPRGHQMLVWVVLLVRGLLSWAPLR